MLRESPPKARCQICRFYAIEELLYTYHTVQRQLHMEADDSIKINKASVHQEIVHTSTVTEQPRAVWFTCKYVSPGVLVVRSWYKRAYFTHQAVSEGL